MKQATKPTWTPGPWLVTTPSNGKRGRDIWICTNEMKTIYDSLLPDAWPLSEANARLIAQAPAMYEALEAIAAHGGKCIFSHDECCRASSADAFSQMASIAQTVLAAADGRES